MKKWQSVFFAFLMNIPMLSMADNATLRVGLNPWIGNGLFHIAQEKGFFDREKIHVELIKYNDGPIAKQLLASNKIDLIPTTPETPLVLANAGIPIKVIGILNNSEGADGIVSTQEIKTIKDLKDKNIAFEGASSSHLLLSMLLQENGLKLQDIHPKNLSAADSGAAFIAGKVDAAVTWEPWLGNSIKRKGGHILATSSDVALFPDFYIFRAEIVKEQPKTIKAMLRALFSAVDFTQAHPEETASIIAKHYGITPEMAKKQIKTLKWFGYKDNVQYFDKTTPYNAYTVLQNASDLWFKLGIIQKQLDAASLVDDTILKTLYVK